MKYKANVSFAGKIYMKKGEVRELSDNTASPLLKCKYIEPVEEVNQNENKSVDDRSNLQSNKRSSRKSGTS